MAVTRRQLPVLIGMDYKHIMCEAVIIEENDAVTITMTAKGQDANDLISVMTAQEPVALSFVAIPVKPRATNPEETM